MGGTRAPRRGRQEGRRMGGGWERERGGQNCMRLLPGDPGKGPGRKKARKKAEDGTGCTGQAGQAGSGVGGCKREEEGRVGGEGRGESAGLAGTTRGRGSGGCPRHTGGRPHAAPLWGGIAMEWGDNCGQIGRFLGRGTRWKIPWGRWHTHIRSLEALSKAGGPRAASSAPALCQLGAGWHETCRHHQHQHSSGGTRAGSSGSRSSRTRSSSSGLLSGAALLGQQHRAPAAAQQ